LCKGRRDIASTLCQRLRLVAVVQRKIALGPNLYGARLERFFVVEDKRQDLVLHRNQREGFLGHVTIHGGNSGHRLADKSHRVIERKTVLCGDLLGLVAVLLSAGDRTRTPDDVSVLVRENRFDARESTRPRDVDRRDARVRMRAAQYSGVQHARELNVVGIFRLAADPLARIDARRRMAHRGQGRHTEGRSGRTLLAHCAPPALLVRALPTPAATTAST
jgi:hypothetical protein